MEAPRERDASTWWRLAPPLARFPVGTAPSPAGVSQPLQAKALPQPAPLFPGGLCSGHSRCWPLDPPAMAPCPGLPRRARRCAREGLSLPLSLSSAQPAGLAQRRRRPEPRAVGRAPAAPRGRVPQPVSKRALKPPAASSHSCAFRPVTGELPCTPEGKAGSERAGGVTGTMKRVRGTAPIALAWDPDRRAEWGSQGPSVARVPASARASSPGSPAAALRTPQGKLGLESEV